VTAGRFPVGVRVLDLLAGLLAAGILLLGLLLLLAAILAPAVLAAAGLGQAQGPGWISVLSHLAVGGLGELVVRRRSRWPATARWLADLAVIVAALAVIWWGWLP
jgi:hypothetical protein